MLPSLIVFVLSSCPMTAFPQDTHTVPQEVRDIVGTYTGAWSMYAINDKGEVVKRMGWTDTLKMENPQVKGDRVFVTGIDDMKFDGGKIPPSKYEFNEGFFLKKDGTVGDAFIESGGQVQRMTRVADNVWTYVAPASARDLAGMGLPQGATGQHVLVKVVTKEQGAETHRISRVSTVTWKDKDGQERTLQFVSLQGYHKKQP